MSGFPDHASFAMQLHNSRSSLPDLEGATSPVQPNCAASLYEWSQRAECISGTHPVVHAMLGIAGLSCCIPIASPSTPLSPVSQLWFAVVALVSSASVCSETCITALYFADVTGSCRFGYRQLMTSAILSFPKSCTVPWRLRRDVACLLHFLVFPARISAVKMVPYIRWLCKNQFWLDPKYTSGALIWLKRYIRDYYRNPAKLGDY